jgi:hypothetical protein
MVSGMAKLAVPRHGAYELQAHFTGTVAFHLRPS